MLNVLKDKRVWIGLIATVLIIIGSVCAVLLVNKFDRQGDNKGVEKETVIDDNKPYDEDGMEVIEDGKTQEDSMEVPKSWEEPSTGETPTNNTDNNEDENTSNDNASDDNTLKDDTSWGTIF